MSDLGQQFRDMLKNNAQRIGPEIGAEMKRLATQGAMELASALFNGHGFVPYGPGQYTPSNDNQVGKEAQPGPEVHEPQIDAAQQQHRGRSL